MIFYLNVFYLPVLKQVVISNPHLSRSFALLRNMLKSILGSLKVPI